MNIKRMDGKKKSYERKRGKAKINNKSRWKTKQNQKQTDKTKQKQKQKRNGFTHQTTPWHLLTTVRLTVTVVEEERR